MAATVATLEDLEPLRRELAELRALVGARSAGDTLTTEQAAEVAGVKPKTIRAWVADGMAADRRGRRLLIRREVLDAWRTGPTRTTAELMTRLTAAR